MPEFDREPFRGADLPIEYAGTTETDRGFAEGDTGYDGVVAENTEVTDIDDGDGYDASLDGVPDSTFDAQDPARGSEANEADDPYDSWLRGETAFPHSGGEDIDDDPEAAAQARRDGYRQFAAERVSKRNLTGMSAERVDQIVDSIADQVGRLDQAIQDVHAARAGNAFEDAGTADRQTAESADPYMQQARQLLADRPLGDGETAEMREAYIRYTAQAMRLEDMINQAAPEHAAAAADQAVVAGDQPATDKAEATAEPAQETDDAATETTDEQAAEGEDGASTKSDRTDEEQAAAPNAGDDAEEVTATGTADEPQADAEQTADRASNDGDEPAIELRREVVFREVAIPDEEETAADRASTEPEDDDNDAVRESIRAAEDAAAEPARTEATQILDAAPAASTPQPDRMAATPAPAAAAEDSGQAEVGGLATTETRGETRLPEDSPYLAAARQQVLDEVAQGGFDYAGAGVDALEQRAQTLGQALQAADAPAAAEGTDAVAAATPIDVGGDATFAANEIGGPAAATNEPGLIYTGGRQDIGGLDAGTDVTAVTAEGGTMVGGNDPATTANAQQTPGANADTATAASDLDYVGARRLRGEDGLALPGAVDANGEPVEAEGAEGEGGGEAE